MVQVLPMKVLQLVLPMAIKDFYCTYWELSFHGLKNYMSKMYNICNSLYCFVEKTIQILFL